MAAQRRKAPLMNGYPQAIVPVDHVEPVPRRVRAVLGGQVVLDTTRALYLWEWPFYPQFQIPVDDVDAAVLIDEECTHQVSRGVHSRGAGRNDPL